ncbi:MAG: hypothetical protein K2O36_05155 [Ruminococcus sp.]|nr:hypothetical protein [Ruminococcus sp.]MDE7105250.1 hypothetical protein [Ruminococcus sp.]
MNDYNNDFGYDDTYSSESPVITGIKGIVGAVIGAIPGMALWIILGKLGFVFSACGLLIAMGIVFGYGAMTKKGNLPIWFAIIVSLVVFVAVLLLSQKIVWTWEIASTFKEYLPTFREDIISSVIAEDSSMTRADVESILTDDMYNQVVKESFGVTEGTFGECFANFNVLLENLEIKGKYMASLVKSCLFGLLGGVALFAKMGKN